MGRPWANGLARLLTERRLKKGELAELAGVRPGTISAVANSPQAPDVATLMRIVEGLTQFDRRGKPNAPAVELWEFFVSDEQAALLRQSAQKQQQLQQEDVIARIIQRVVPAVLQEFASESGQPAPQPATHPGHVASEPPPPGVSLPRGKLQDRRRA